MSIYHDEIEIEDFEFDDEEEMYYYPCPCGDRFEISKVSAPIVRIEMKFSISATTTKLSKKRANLKCNFRILIFFLRAGGPNCRRRGCNMSQLFAHRSCHLRCGKCNLNLTKISGSLLEFRTYLFRCCLISFAFCAFRICSRLRKTMSPKLMKN